MASVNKVILVGNLGKDPEIRHTADSVPVASFSLATTEVYKDKNGEKKESTEWHNIVLWRGLAEVAQKYLKKGKSVYIEGKIRTRSYEQDGVKKYMTEIVADNLVMLGKREDDMRNESSSYPVESTKEQVSEPVAPPMDDDLPF